MGRRRAKHRRRRESSSSSEKSSASSVENHQRKAKRHRKKSKTKDRSKASRSQSRIRTAEPVKPAVVGGLSTSSIQAASCDSERGCGFSEERSTPALPPLAVGGASTPQVLAGSGSDRRAVNRRLFSSLFYATQVVDQVADMFEDMDHHQWQRSIFGHSFSVARPSVDSCNLDTRKTVIQIFGSWLRAHEEAQVMLASILVVVAIWWLVRTILSLVINLLCPLVVVFVAVVCVPQLRTPLIGQNYPALAKVLRNILLKLAENINI